jgi:hypothetical protein
LFRTASSIRTGKTGGRDRERDREREQEEKKERRKKRKLQPFLPHNKLK